MWFVVRLGKSEGVSEVVTYPKKQYLGEVILSSAPEPDTMMESTNPNVQSGKHSFLADWAVIRLRNALNDPMKVCYDEKKLCHHINGIINVPATGTAAVIGASSREYRMEPWTGTYRCPIINDGLPTTLSPGSWGDNRKELLCWSLSCPRDMDKDKWFDHGIGIKGDSGAGVVDCKTGFLCGLVVGDTKGKLTSGGRYRKAHIIDMLDVKEDTVRAAKASNINLAFKTAEIIKCDCPKASRRTCALTQSAQKVTKLQSECHGTKPTTPSHPLFSCIYSFAHSILRSLPLCATSDKCHGVIP